MFKWTSQCRRSVAQRAPSPLEIFNQVQQGVAPPIASQRAFLLEHFRTELSGKGIHESKLVAMDLRTCSRLLRRLVLERFLAIPFRHFTFDMEFTDAPRFTAEGPTADIIEIGLYSPVRDERMSVLVRTPQGRPIMPHTTELTGITNEMLEKDGVPFVEAWRQVDAFLSTPEPQELPGSANRMLLLSHGGKLADVSMLQWALKKHQIEMPPSLVFGDTFNIIRDAHRRRPVTPDKHPPSWRLADLVSWLRVDTSEVAHRAGDDAKLTWDALYHTLERYGEESLSPRQQLVLRFFDDVAKAQMSVGGSDPAEAVSSLDLDAIFGATSMQPSTGAAGGSLAVSTSDMGDGGHHAPFPAGPPSHDRRGARKPAAVTRQRAPKSPKSAKPRKSSAGAFMAARTPKPNPSSSNGGGASVIPASECVGDVPDI